MQHTLVNPPALLKLGSMNIKSVFKNAMYATTYSCMNAITPSTSLICKMLKSYIKRKLQPPENLSKGFTAIFNRHVSTVPCKYLRFMILSSVIMLNCDFSQLGVLIVSRIQRRRSKYLAHIGKISLTAVDSINISFKIYVKFASKIFCAILHLTYFCTSIAPKFAPP